MLRKVRLRKGRKHSGTGNLQPQILRQALADFFRSDYDGKAAYIVLAHLSEQNNIPEIARGAAEAALGKRQTLFKNRVMLASQAEPTEPIRL